MTKLNPVAAHHCTLTTMDGGTEAYLDTHADLLSNAGAQRYVIEIGSVDGPENPEQEYVTLLTLDKMISMGASQELMAFTLAAYKQGALYLVVSAP